MHNTCVSSSFSVRYRGPPSFSFNDYRCCFNDTFDRNPLLKSASLSSQCCECCCCSDSFHPSSYLYGLRQSTLIQWSPYKRLILNGLDPCYGSRFTVCDVARSCFCENYEPKERKVCGRRGKLGRKSKCMVFEEESERHSLSGGVEEVEIMLSLLSEDANDECFSMRERRGKSVRKIDVKGGNGGGNARSRKKNVESGTLDSLSKFEYEAEVIRSREVGKSKDTRREDEREILLRSNWRGRAKKEGRVDRLEENASESMREEKREILLRNNQRERIREEERDSLSRREDHRPKLRKDGSSCSSYYSLSSGEFESNDEIQVHQEGYESSGGCRKDSRRGQEMVSDEVRKDFARHGHSKEYGVSKEKNQAGFSGASSVVKSDWRNKSEKKLTDVSIAETQYGKESAQNLSTYREDKENTYGKAFGSYSRSDDRNKMSTLSVNVDDRIREQNRQTSETETRMKYKQFTEVSDTFAADLETSSTSNKLHKRMDESSSKSSSSVQEAKEQHLTAEQIRREEEYRGSSRKFAISSKVQELENRRISTDSQSETRMKYQEDHSTRIQSSVHDTEEHHHQRVEASRIKDSRIKHQQLTTDVNKESTSVSHRDSESRIKYQEDHSTRTQSSVHDTEEQRRQTVEASRITDSRIKHQQLTDVNKESTSVSHRESENRVRKQEVKSSFVYNSNLETRENLQETSSEHVNTLEYRKGSHEVIDISFPSKSDVVVDTDKRKLEMIMSSSPSQSAAAGSLHDESSSGLKIEEIVDEKLDSGSTAPGALEELGNESMRETKGDESYGPPLKLVSPEDALGSADRLQKSSARYFGDFVQKAKSEISSSQTHRVKDTYKAKLLSKDEKHDQASLGSVGSEVSELKEQDSRRTSQGSGTKGPSDEMWDVTEPTIGEPPEVGAVAAERTTENAVAKRSGKSLWNVIADVIHFRWASRSENRSSPSKSAGKSSPNQSTSSETFFSGHDQEEINDSNLQKERTSLQVPLSIEQRQEEKISSSRVDGSRSSSSKDLTKHNTAGASTSSVVLQKDSSPKATSLPLDEASAPTKLKATAAVTEGVELSLPLPALHVGVLATRETEPSGGGKVGQVDQPVPVVLSSKPSPESKSEELKRRKLQRIDQVQKDRFDEWEEAYRFETEQRKMDEMFMREALLEARKAADSWEVPVGAVLVQDGKIIARGYNL